MYRLRLSATPQYICGINEQTAEHVLQECPLYDQLKKISWPNGTTLHSNLYKAMNVLQITVKLILLRKVI
jgi:hypothetical protein